MRPSFFAKAIILAIAGLIIACMLLSCGKDAPTGEQVRLQQRMDSLERARLSDGWDDDAQQRHADEYNERQALKYSK